jgi:bifunctional non-homologous end joining protein LigD
VKWSELPKLGSGAQWNIRTVHTRLAEGNSPWNGYRKGVRSVKPAMKLLERAIT